MDQANRPEEISRATVEEVSTSGEHNDYETRKLDGRCTYPRCPDLAGDGCQLCPAHHADYLARKRDSQNALRADRRRRGLCPRCGTDKTDEYMCAECRVRNGRNRIARGAVEHNGEHNGRDHIVEADGYARKRYYGRAKRGAPGVDAQDEIERRIIKACLARYLEACEFLSSPAAKSLEPDDRRKRRLAALGQLDLATRAADDILERNRFPEKQAKERERKALVMRGEIQKAGR